MPADRLLLSSRDVPAASSHHVVPSIREEASGIALAVREFCRGLAEVGNDVRLYVTEASGHEPAGYDLHIHPSVLGLRRLGMAPSLHAALLASVTGSCVLHSHGMWAMPNVYPGIVKEATGCSLVVSPHGTLGQWPLQHSFWKKRFSWWVLGQRWTLARADAFHVTSPAEAEDVRRLGFRQPIAVIPYGNTPIVPPPDEERATRAVRRLLYFGRIHSKKGVLELVHAWHRLAADFPDWELVVAGKDDEPGYAERVRAAAAEAPRCTVRGPAYGAEKAALYGSADVLVLHTHNENFGLVVPEALSAEVPCVVSHGAPWEGLEAHGCGWWVERTDAALEGALRAAMGLPEGERRGMGRRGRAWAEAAFSWERAATRLDGLYTWLREGGPPPADTYTT